MGLVGCLGAAWAQQRGGAEAAVLEGRADEAIQMLRTQLAVSSGDARAHLLLCRVLLAEELADQAVAECEQAAEGSPRDSEAQLWLGRAYGAKATAANPLVAFPLARRVRGAFERAVELDGNNGPALSDLGQYYVQAPAIVGGGAEKARALAERMMPGQPARAHRLLGQLAEKTGDLRTAEAEYRAAGSSPGALVDLAQFFLSHGRPEDALAAVRAAVAADRTHGPEVVDAAQILVEANRARDLAVSLMRQYLQSAAKTDAAPAFRVHVLLGDALARVGDSRGAAAEYVAARGLASGYRVAQRAPGTGHGG